MGRVVRPRHCCETQFDTFQDDLPVAILAASRVHPSHRDKANRLEFVQHLILMGANPMKMMQLQDEEATPMQRAIEYGDPMVIKAMKEAMTKFTTSAPVIVSLDFNALREQRTKRKLPVAILFPGQGSQYVGMLEEAQHLEPCKKLIEKANEILGYDILKLCREGPEEKLEETKYCQPAMFVANACALEKLRLEKPEVVERAVATAGLSLGEYNSLVLSGMIGFEETLRVVRLRAEGMQDCAKNTPQAMLSVAGLDLATLERLCKRVVAESGKAPDGGDQVCVIANHLFDKGYSCSGHKGAIEMLREMAMEEGALQARVLKLQVACHTKLMEPAGVKLYKSLRAKVTEMTFPKMDIYMNVRGVAQRTGTDQREINYDLAAQISNPVLWKQCVESMIKDGVTEFYECGPMKQLKAIMKRISQDAWEQTTSVHV